MDDILEYDLEFILACALVNDTWLSWIPKEVLEKVPDGIAVSISCTPDGTWIILNKQFEIVWSSKEMDISPFNAEEFEYRKEIYAKLTKEIVPPPTPKRVA